MIVSPLQLSPSVPTHGTDKAIALALRLAHAENALHALTSGQVDAIIDPDGRAYLLRPAQEHLRQNERRLQAMLDSTVDVIVVVNRAGAILSHNRAASRMLASEPDELTGKSIFEFVDPSDLPLLYSAFFNVIEDFRSDATAEFRCRTRDGSFHLLEVTLGKMRESGAPSVVLTCRDTKNRRWPAQEESDRREAALNEAARAKDRFLAMLSHELRTPLNPVFLGFYELEEDDRFAEARPTLAMIRRNLDVQSCLLDELIDFVTIGSHKVRLRLEPIDAHQTIGFVLEICQSEIASARIDVQLDLRATEHLVLADSTRIQQVMWNLLKNAIKFSPPGSSISIATRNPEADQLTIEFTDHGIGIEPELLPLVFQPFVQAAPPQKKIQGGLGLGLFIAQGLAEAQGGTLTVLSEGHNRGTTFCLALATTSPDLATPPTEKDTGLFHRIIQPLS